MCLAMYRLPGIHTTLSYSCTSALTQKQVSEMSFHPTTSSERREDHMASLGSPGTYQTEVGSEDP